MTISRGNNPSIDPANNNSLAGTLQFVFNKMIQGIDGMLPAKVIAFDRETNRVQVQLLIQMITTDNTLVSRPQIASVPVLMLGGGGYMINFPLNPGNLGWVLANDRDISLFLQTYDEAQPNTWRVKQFSDGVFIPDIMTNFTVNPEDDGNLVISTTDGTVRISISPLQVKITAPLLLVDGNIAATGTITPGV